MEEFLFPVVIVGMLFIGFPWIIFHYITRWKTQATLTKEDEQLLDDLYELGRRLEERIVTIERIIAADNPGWRSLSEDTTGLGIEDELSAKRNLK